jgi:hypothetical protein
MAATYANAKAEVGQLVDRFARLSAHNRKHYNEPATRQEFILPLFRALGWNVDDAREVSPEEKVSRGFVDFSFRLGGIPRFFLETKKILTFKNCLGTTAWRRPRGARTSRSRPRRGSKAGRTTCSCRRRRRRAPGSLPAYTTRNLWVTRQSGGVTRQFCVVERKFPDTPL